MGYVIVRMVDIRTPYSHKCENCLIPIKNVTQIALTFSTIYYVQSGAYISADLCELLNFMSYYVSDDSMDLVVDIIREYKIKDIICLESYSINNGALII